MNKLKLKIAVELGTTYFESYDRIEYLQVIQVISGLPQKYNPLTREDNFKTFEQRMKNRYE